MRQVPRRRRSNDIASALAILASFGAISSGCVLPPRTQVVLRLSTDMVTGRDELSSVRLEVSRNGALLQQLEYYLCPVGRNRLPGDVGFIVQESNATQALDFQITAYQGQTPLFTRKISVQPVIGRFLAVDVFLARRCVVTPPLDCGEGLSCGETGCEAPILSVLPTDAGSLTPHDAETCENATADSFTADRVGDRSVESAVADVVLDAAQDASLDAVIDGGQDTSFDGGADASVEASLD